MWVIVQQQGAYSNMDWEIVGVITTNKQDAIEKSKQYMIDWITDASKWVKNISEEDFQKALEYITYVEADSDSYETDDCWTIRHDGLNFAYQVEDFKVYIIEVEPDKLDFVEQLTDDV